MSSKVDGSRTVVPSVEPLLPPVAGPGKIAVVLELVADEHLDFAKLLQQQRLLIWLSGALKICQIPLGAFDAFLPLPVYA